MWLNWRTYIIWHATSDFYPAFFNESYVNFWEFCVCLHSNIGLVLSSGEVNSTLFLWKPLDISLVQKLENAGWMSSQIKIWLINVWVNLIKLLEVHSRTPTDFINIQKFKANLIVAFPSSFIWPWIRTGFILTLPHVYRSVVNGATGPSYNYLYSLFSMQIYL